MKLLIVIFSLVSMPAWAQDFLSETESAVDPEASSAVEFDMGRDPAATPSALNVKRSYPGGADEEDLRVLPALPEAAMKTDTRTVQREVYKTLYNQDLKDERHDPVEE